MIEFEMKFKAEHDAIKPILKKLGAQYIRLEHHQDTYFNHPSRDFGETDEALRIRTMDGETSVTYKGPKFNQKSKSRLEIDIGVESPNFQDIFIKLGFIKSGEVIKTREVWKMGEIMLCLDDVKHLGNYLELEIMGESEESLTEMTGILGDLASSFNIDPSSQIPRSYLELLMEK